MKINADFSQRVVVRFDDNDWLASPMPGVDRKMMDRIGDEVARATTIVRYAPGSAFSPHTHDGGEEFLVLDGTFVDEHGAFPTGTYVRNPPTSRHTPSAPEGAVILVKLHQFDPEDRQQVALATSGNDAPSVPLYSAPNETVRLENWAANSDIALDTKGGIEIFVIEGGFTQEGSRLGPWDWLRLPDGTEARAVAGPQGARVWIKSGHLAALTPSD